MLKVTQLCIFGGVILILQAAAVPSFDINLNLPPEKRWGNVTKYYKDDMLALMSMWNGTLRNKFQPDPISDWMQVAKTEVSEEYRAEIQGMVNDLDLPPDALELMLTFNFLYEMGSPTMCSGVLAADTDGKVVHGRNMDYTFKYEMPDGTQRDWPDVTFDTVYWKDGRKLMTSVQWPWFTGIHTGMRYDGWTFEQNSRLSENHEGANLMAAKKGGVSFPWTVRKVLETTLLFEDAVQQLNDTNFMAPHYFVMAGAGPFQGAVLTIDRGGKLLEGTPSLRRLEKEAGVWHLLQTNDDVTKAPRDPRRPIVEFALSKKVQEDVSETFVSDMMRSLPLLNDVTAFSWLAIPETGYHFTTVRNGSVKSKPSMPLVEEIKQKVVRPIRSKWTHRATLALRP